MSTERPILFNSDMTRAILEGRKTQTRRAIRFTKNDVYDHACARGMWYEGYDPQHPPEQLCEWYARSVAKKPCAPGDILWVRETWCKDVGRYMYRANYADDERFYRNGKEVRITWHPSIHMPKEAARIFLRVKSVRVERLQEINIVDCACEGIWDDYKTTSEAYHHALKQVAYPKVFAGLWDDTIKPADLDKYGWNANPWVWVITFERCDKPESWCCP